MSFKKAKELRISAAEVATEARGLLDSITDDTSTEQATETEARFDDMMVKHDQLMAHADREEKLARAEERASQGIHGNPLQDAESSTDNDTPSYRDAFHKMLRAGGQAAYLDSETRAVLAAGVTEFRAQNVSEGEAGGYSVPVELMNKLIETMKMHGPMYDSGLISEMNTSSGHKVEMPTIDDTDKTAASREELAPIVDDGSGDISLGKKHLDAFVYATPFVKWSKELTQDSIFNVEALLNNLLGKRLGRLANRVLTLGTGNEQPHGVVSAVDQGVTAVSANTLIADELIDLFHSIDPAYRASASSLAYMMNDRTLAAMRKLKDGQGNYLWQMGNIQQGIPQTLNNVRVVVNQDMPDMTTGNKAILFGDFKQYYVRKVMQPTLGIMRERFWPDLGIAGLIRFDGELLDNNAIKALIMA